MSLPIESKREFDEEADEEDKKMLSNMLDMNNLSRVKPILGL